MSAPVNSNVYAQKDYRDAIRLKLKEAQSKTPGLTLKRIAQKISIQYTYLSKALNDESTHLSEDHLYGLCDQLKLAPEEREFILMQRAHASAHRPERKKDLYRRIEQIRKARRLKAEVQEFNSSRLYDEMSYLCDPLASLVHVALDIESVRKNPRLLCARLGLEPAELKAALLKLSRNEFIELDADSLTVKRLIKNHLHFVTDHPLMRVHQNLLKTVMQSQLIRCPEEAKQSFIATFTADDRSVTLIKEEFNKFMSAVETIATKARSESLYQLSFDLFRWI